MYDKKRTEYAIKQDSDRYYPVMINKEAGIHYEIKNSLTGGVLSYWPDPVDCSTRNESGGWGRQDLVLVTGVCRCGVYPVEGVSAGAGR